jgi:hypothetical protein
VLVLCRARRLPLPRTTLLLRMLFTCSGRSCLPCRCLPICERRGLDCGERCPWLCCWCCCVLPPASWCCWNGEASCPGRAAEQLCDSWVPTVDAPLAAAAAAAATAAPAVPEAALALHEGPAANDTTGGGQVLAPPIWLVNIAKPAQSAAKKEPSPSSAFARLCHTSCPCCACPCWARPCWACPCCACPCCACCSSSRVGPAAASSEPEAPEDA